MDSTAEGESTLRRSDAELVVESQSGNEAAFEELVRRHMNKAVQVAFVILGNYEDAKDVSQDAFVKAYRALRFFNRQAQFATWFYRILVNTAKDFLRHKNWKRFLQWDARESMESFFERIEDPGQSPARVLLNVELEKKISQAIAHLPLKQQCVFIFRFIKGLSIQEIGEATGLAEGSVKATLHFAVQKFKDRLSPYLKGGNEHGLRKG